MATGTYEPITPLRGPRSLTDVADLYREMEACRLIVDSTSPFNNVNPNRQGPIGYDYWQKDSRPSRWTCSYCGGSRDADFDNCPGCGAGRV